jgi:hypothetical protein
MALNEYNYFQLNPITDMGETLGPGNVSRDLDMKMSNFNAMYFGSRMSTDYTRTVLDFKDKSELENRKPIWQDAEFIDNPFVSGSTVKRIRDDQAWRMGMANDNGTAVTKPMFDVSDTKAVLGTMTKGKNYPSEGWRSFGGKYDFSEAYNGMVR